MCITIVCLYAYLVQIYFKEAGRIFSKSTGMIGDEIQAHGLDG